MPLANAVEQVIHGTLVRDPFRWLEDRSLAETESWIRDQQRRCASYFADCPGLAEIEHRVRKYLDVEVIDQPVRVPGHYFYRKRALGQEQSCLYRRNIADGVERLLVDPSADGPYVSAGIHRVSPSGCLMAVEVKRGGEDRKEIRIVDTESGNILPDCISTGYGRGIAFSRNGYFYCQDQGGSDEEHTIRYHSLGSSGQDAIVFRVPRKLGSRLVLVANEAWLGALWLHPDDGETFADFWRARLEDDLLAWSEVFRNRRAPYSPVLWHDRIFALVETASRTSKLIELSRAGEELGVFVPEKQIPIRQIAITRERIFLSYLDRSIATIDAWMLNGEPAGSLNLPPWGSIEILPLRTQQSDNLFYSYESFDTPPAIYEHLSQTNTSALWSQRGPSDLKTRCHVQVTAFPAKDGTSIPLTLVSAKTDRVTPAPVIMTCYGGFGVSITPQFSVFATIMMELGATLALPHIRGGGEFGRSWHEAARKRNRQTAFDDFIAAAEWLCHAGITTPSQLAIFGGSNSGLLVGAAMTQRPDLFGAVLCLVPLLDMIRYESFDEAVRWRSEYGTVEDREDFQALYAYSPYHHVHDEVDYPPTLFVSGDKDDRCNPAHTRKMAALLESRPAQKNPVIVDYSTERGHSPVLPLSERIAALARRIAFLCRETHVPPHFGGSDEAPRP